MTAATLDAFALMTTDTAWIKRNRGEVEDGRVYVLVPAAERVTFAGKPWRRYTFTDVPADFPNGVVMCPEKWVDPHVDCVAEDHDTSLPDHWEREEQAATPDREHIACNHCGPSRPIAWCRNTEDWIHLTDPQDGCFLIPGRG